MKKIICVLIFALCCGLSELSAQYAVGDVFEKDDAKAVVFYVDETGEHGLAITLNVEVTKEDIKKAQADSKAQKKAVNLALLFGKSGSSSSLVGTDGQKWIATQLVVWEFCTGCRDASTFKLSNSKFIDGITAGDHNPNVKTNYNKIIAKLNSYECWQ